MRTLIYSLAVVMAALAGVSAADAAVVTLKYDFSSSDYMNTGPGFLEAPYNPAIGSITVTFDTDVAVTDQTAGVIVNNLNVPVAGPVAFSYTPMGYLDFGAILGPLDGVAWPTAGTADFLARIYNPLNADGGAAAVLYAVAGLDTYWIPGSGHWTSTAVPEPTTWALMIAGFGLAGGGLRRRRMALPLKP